MIYNWGTQDIPPARLFDANGLEWGINEDTQQVDTETGECLIIKKDGNGQIMGDGKNVLTEPFKIAAPAVVKFLSPLRLPIRSWQEAYEEFKRENNTWK